MKRILPLALILCSAITAASWKVSDLLSKNTISIAPKETRPSFSGSFDDVKALELLYGPYQPKEKAALWSAIVPPEHIKNCGSAEFPNGGLVRPILSQMYEEGGVVKQLFLTTAQPIAEDEHKCHACQPLIGGAIFVKSGTGWVLNQSFPYLMVTGQWGDPPKLSWRMIGKDRHGLFVSGHGMQMGSFHFSEEVLEILDTGRARVLLSVREEFDTDHGNPPAPDGTDVSIRLTPVESLQDFWDIRATVKWTVDGNLTRMDSRLYRGEFGLYRLVSGQKASSESEEPAVCVGWESRGEDKPFDVDFQALAVEPVETNRK